MGRPEDSRVKIPALVHFTRLGYSYVSLHGLKKGQDYDGDTNIFFRPFQSALMRINHRDLSYDETIKAVNELKIRLSNDDLGKEFFQILHNGLNGLKLIDFEDLDANEFQVMTELPYENEDDNFRPDIVVLLNGMPLSFMEVKRQNNKDGILVERNRMESRFSNPIYKRFANITQFAVFSNNNPYDDTEIEPVQGSFYAASSYGKMFFSRFREQREQEIILSPTDSSVERFILKDTNLLSILGTAEYRSACSPYSPANSIISSLYSKKRFLFLLHYGICYKTFTDKESVTHIEKHIMRYPQIFATLALRDSLNKNIRRGIIWHTQGSGKTALAFSNFNVLRDYFQKKGVVAQFFFIVDRLDLADQASSEFRMRGMDVRRVDSKDEFIKVIGQTSSTTLSGKPIVTVVNIQKFSEESITRPSDYNVNIQRIYFLDEAHRSYNPGGSMLANLMASDRSAVHIALTGTPLIGQEYNTKAVFGDYIHTYYYNQSIADGYTLKLIREAIKTSYREKLSETLKELEVMEGSLSRSELYAHEKFVGALTDFIIEDFRKSRVMMDETIGGMIVCDSSAQARAISRSLENREFSHALVLHDEGSKEERKKTQEDFKKGAIDLLVVYNMLLTGFDAPRLKKLYLNRIVKAHNLLQTLTRVNRPYRQYHYGYVVDFADIRKEFDKTNKAYFEELEKELGSEVKNYTNIFRSQEEIERSLEKINNLFFLYDTSNAVKFIDQINAIEDPKELLELRKALEEYKSLYNIAHAYGHDELAKLFTLPHASKLLNEVVNRIGTLTLKKAICSNEEMQSTLNLALDQIDFNFRKIKTEELVIADSFKKALERARQEVVSNCLDPKDPISITLMEELRRIFQRKNIEELTSEEMKEASAELEKLTQRAAKQNRQDKLLAERYAGDIKFLHVHKRCSEQFERFRSQPILLHKILSAIKQEVDSTLEHNEGLLDNPRFFEENMGQPIVRILKSNGDKPVLPELKFFKASIAHEYLIERNIAS